MVAVSTRDNLDLCLRHGLAGFPSSYGGVWTFEEILEGDFISFLYAARAFNLYQVVKREALCNAETLPPWPGMTSKRSKQTYYFPFRLWLKPIRAFSEPLVRAEFSYVAENLLLRGGYKRTHFQADQTTLQSVSSMGSVTDGPLEPLSLPAYRTFTPLFARKRSEARPPEVFLLREDILQTAIRRYLMEGAHLARLLAEIGLASIAAETIEVLSEKALPEGHIDLLLKERVPLGSAVRIPVEVKSKQAQPRDVAQLQTYVTQLADECPTGVLIAAEFGQRTIREAANLGLHLLRYRLNHDWEKPAAFETICRNLQLESVR